MCYVGTHRKIQFIRQFYTVAMSVIKGNWAKQNVKISVIPSHKTPINTFHDVTGLD